MKVNTPGLMQNIEVLQSVQRRAVELVKVLEHESLLGLAEGELGVLSLEKTRLRRDPYHSLPETT